MWCRRLIKPCIWWIALQFHILAWCTPTTLKIEYFWSWCVNYLPFTGPRHWTYCWHTPKCTVTTKADRLVFFIPWISQFSNQEANIVFEASSVLPDSPIVTPCGAPKRPQLTPHNSVVKGRCARDTLPYIFYIYVFNCSKTRLPQ